MADGYSGPRPNKVHRDEVELMTDEQVSQVERHDADKMEEQRSGDHGVVLDDDQVEDD